MALLSRDDARKKETMKRNLHLIGLGTLLALVIVPFSFAQDDDLAGLARQQRAHKQAPTKVYDNDNMPQTEHISVVGSESAAPSATDSTKAPADSASQSSNAEPANNGSNKDEAKKEGDSKPAAIQPGQSPGERQQAYDDWQSKIKEQKAAVDLAQRELDVTQREYRLRAAVVANDVGYRLRNSAQWDKEDKHYKDDIAAKQKTLDDAKQKLADFQEQARKAGLPSKLSE